MSRASCPRHRLWTQRLRWLQKTKHTPPPQPNLGYQLPGRSTPPIDVCHGEKNIYTAGIELICSEGLKASLRDTNYWDSGRCRQRLGVGTSSPFPHASPLLPVQQIIKANNKAESICVDWNWDSAAFPRCPELVVLNRQQKATGAQHRDFDEGLNGGWSASRKHLEHSVDPRSSGSTNNHPGLYEKCEAAKARFNLLQKMH